VRLSWCREIQKRLAGDLRRLRELQGLRQLFGVLLQLGQSEVHLGRVHLRV